MTKIQLTLTEDQACVTAKALDLYARLSIGQIGMISEMISMDEIPAHPSADSSPRRVSADDCGLVHDKIGEILKILGYSGFGHSLGISHRHVPISGHRAYEISRVLDKVLAERRDPNPKFRGVNYDGLRIRYTQDPAPECSVVSDSQSTAARRDLCTWLRANSSGIYRPAAEAANELERLESAAARLLKSLDKLDEGCREPGFAGFENGNGEQVGDEIESARQALKLLTE